MAKQKLANYDIPEEKIEVSLKFSKLKFSRQ